jgi:tRNA1Val (adenine37-N6)-methyltransferase
MKVSTDACLLGALAAEYLSAAKNIPTILDIGAGTGLLSLMLAQQTKDNRIDALETEESAFGQAAENFKNSPWGDRLNIFHIAVQDWPFAPERSAILYDFIICNPPFFQNHLPSPDKQRNTARHGVLLSPGQLLKAVSSLLEDKGLFCVLYPETGRALFQKAALQHGLYLKRIVKVFPKPGSPCNRNIAFFAKEKPQAATEEPFIIYRTDGKYSNGFIALLKDYYLNL